MSKKISVPRVVRASVMCVFSLCFCVVAVAQDEPTINLKSTIKGNQEQPSVIYIVPWKTLAAPPAAYQPLKSTLQANYQLIDRDEFRRELRSRRAIATQTQPVTDHSQTASPTAN